MENRINGLREYLDAAHSVFHAVEGLRSILENAMTEIMYEVPSRSDITEVEITPECIRGEGKPKYILK